METSPESDLLNSELQELYLLSKHWMSDLDFLTGELDFLRKLYGRTFSPSVKKDEFQKISEILNTAAGLDKLHLELKAEVPTYLHHLEKFIVDFTLNLEVDLVETHAILEIKLNRLWFDYKALKKIVFNLNNNKLQNTGTNEPMQNQEHK